MRSEPVPEGIPIDGDWWGDLDRRYRTPPRAYHGPEHVREVLAQWTEVDAEGGWTDRPSTWLAVLLHDIVYVAGQPDNEERSAALAPRFAADHGMTVDTARSADLIRLTARHGHLRPGDVDPEAALFLDCDMAILGSEPARFDRYDAAIREEYATLGSPDAIATARRAFLARLLEGPIFLSDRFQQRYEAQARANIARFL